MTIVFDNQPKNKDVCKLISKYIDLGYQVCIWPESIIEKDINDMVDAGIDVQSIIDNSTFAGLSAKLKFTKWKKWQEYSMEANFVLRVVRRSRFTFTWSDNLVVVL